METGLGDDRCRVASRTIPRVNIGNDYVRGVFDSRPSGEGVLQKFEVTLRVNFSHRFQAIIFRLIQGAARLEGARQQTVASFRHFRVRLHDAVDQELLRVVAFLLL
jgi:hypothetical protein